MSRCPCSVCGISYRSALFSILFGISPEVILDVTPANREEKTAVSSRYKKLHLIFHCKNNN